MTTTTIATSTPISISLFHRKPKSTKPVAPRSVPMPVDAGLDAVLPVPHLTVRAARAIKKLAQPTPEKRVTVRAARAMKHAINAQETMRSIIADQIETITCAMENIQGALDEHADNTEGRALTWVDVSGLQQLVDNLTRAGLI